MRREARVGGTAAAEPSLSLLSVSDDVLEELAVLEELVLEGLGLEQADGTLGPDEEGVLAAKSQMVSSSSESLQSSSKGAAPIPNPGACSRCIASLLFRSSR